MYRVATPKLLDQVRNAIRVGDYSICGTLRHSFATHLIEAGYDIRSPLDPRFGESRFPRAPARSPEPRKRS